MQGKAKNFNSKGKFIKSEKNDEKTGIRDKDKNYSETKSKLKKENTAEVSISKENSQVEEREDIVIGRNAVIEALKGDRTIETLYIANTKLEGSINIIVGLAKEKRVLIKEVDKRKLDSMCDGATHQGVIAKVTPYKYSEVSDILALAEERGEAPFIVILDEVEDPHNLGSIVRTAELFGVHGIIIPKRRSASVSATVYKSSVGAIEHVKIAKVTNLNVTIEDLKQKGIWVYGADIRAEEYSYQVDFSGPCAIIIGNEGRGISKLTVQKCDKLIKIPMVGKINSLNASVAGGIIMYEVLKGRLK
ncbi:23S rRNA (guanosine(2251)-2'-O)-methyltransferase RlmB [Clostridium gelidum]|uniref:23S rRNA (Guanosine(2251)-2'-O)-methyltransferase RlmB n=1 Tax=Clostridium gelidum TaxID=704125 RepID=A0ABM7SYU6_9CLOT|nr:23S rRNA (guanosine(2251)-2'-O)-methyltransferase RlmB [Clostridium gelidum]BCZ44081.1 23S rRNA (guanosine(2251)-2'-O)-methyltransferase RlmB [Clostridium gelidum]